MNFIILKLIKLYKMMKVTNRHNIQETVCFDKITGRISSLCFGLEHIDPTLVALDTIKSMFDGISTRELDRLSADICATKSHDFPDYGKLGGRILISNISKETDENYKNVVNTLYNAEIVSDKFWDFCNGNCEEIQSFFDYSRDYLFDYFAVKTLERSYLLKVNDKIVERPQHMWMRLAIQIHGCHHNYNLSDDEKLLKIKETYDLVSTLHFTHATPSLFNSGTIRPQLSSCFLYSPDDNIESIFKMISDTAKISKWAGGIGMSLSMIRAKGSRIKGTNGKSEGIIPLCKTLESVGRYINQGGKRAGSISVYLEPWHADIFSFVELRKNTGDENLRARDLFLAIWAPDIFMKRIQEDGPWSLMCPDECPGLVDSYGEEFEKLYLKYEAEGRQKKTVKAIDLWNHILEAQVETGMPYLSFKDTVNKRSMQSQLGVIRNSNLCVAPETMILTKTGYQEIKGLVDQFVELWNGEEWSLSEVRKTGENKKLFRVTLSDGAYLDCTPEHKFPILYEPIGHTMVSASDLKTGDRLLRYNLPIVGGDTKYDVKCPIPFVFDVKKSAEYYYYPSILTEQLPLKASLECRLDWVEKLYRMYGYKASSNVYFRVALKDASDQKYYYDEEKNSDDFDTTRVILSYKLHDKFLNNVRLLLQTIGIDSKIKLTSNENYNVVVLSPGNTSKLFETLGFPVDHSVKEDIKYVKIESVKDLGRVSDTYCFNEPKRHMGMFNGILGGNCNEISLFSNSSNIAVCLTADTKILTKNGIKNIIECDGEEILVPMKSDNELVQQQNIFSKARLVYNGTKKVKKLEMIGTPSIKATENHKFLTFVSRNYQTKTNVYEWKEVSNLKPGDKISTFTNNPLHKFDNTFQEDDKFLVAGWCLGDGWYVSQSKRNIFGVCFGPSDIYAKEKVVSMLNEIHQNSEVTFGGRCRPVKTYIDKRSGVVSWVTTKIQFTKYMEDVFGFKVGLGKHKRIPDQIMKSTPQQIASYLSGMFSADGCCLLKGKTPVVSYTSTSKFLLYDIYNLLLCYGIKGKIVWSDITSQGRIELSGKSKIGNFFKFIGFHLCPDKQTKLVEALSFKYKGIEKQQDWATIRNIVDEEKENVYDLTLESGHNFIANGVITHNCNLASICLPKFVDYTPNGPVFNFEKLQNVAGVATYNLNNVIDVNYYPTPECSKTNFDNRPIGIGIQGLADVFFIFGFPFGSEEARELNRKILENIYYGATKMSISLAKKYGTYESFQNSHHSRGKLQFHLCDKDIELTLDWSNVLEDLKKYGMRNSLLTALMPTASTSQICGNTEAFEAITSNLYLRKTMSGEFTVVNNYLIKDLIKLGLWTKDVYEELLHDNGSVQKIQCIPRKLKDIYKTAFEVKMTDILKQAIDRSPFVDHQQSMNLFMKDINLSALNSSHFYSWKNGLKTAVYYLRSCPTVDATKFGLDPHSILRIKKERQELKDEVNARVKETGVCPRDAYLRDMCESCSS
jgi:ribonucleotide reductase alpha subunit